MFLPQDCVQISDNSAPCTCLVSPFQLTCFNQRIENIKKKKTESLKNQNFTLDLQIHIAC